MFIFEDNDLFDDLDAGEAGGGNPLWLALFFIIIGAVWSIVESCG